ncbi:hypothetical protein TRAPUB_11925 [Trametes pubescens]|uniref:Uncharacterized protein n=1 Tax=Trametes pubescens TaxID=154538 RepID=A0A1M2VVM2_TRAPU|nr:hypothetical protein TRAPUB_11925 [Trametes pubescens]
MASTISSSSQSTVAENVIMSMRRSLGELRDTLGSLGQETIQSIREGGEKQIENELKGIEKKMDASEKKQKAEIDEINALVKKVLEEELVRQLADLIQRGVLQDIDDLVKEQVALQLPNHLPQAQREEIQRHKEELARLELELHNAESVRQNAALLMDYDLDLHPLCTPEGAISLNFPRTLGDLFGMEEQTAILLLHEYGRTEAIAAGPNSREKNINEFMRLCGVRYLLVRRRFSS